jgi:hypothetical protein
MSVSPLSTVTADPKVIELQIDADARLAAAAGGVVRFVAESAGLANGTVAELQKSVVAASNEAFEHLTPAHPHLNVTITRFYNRIEVALTHAGGAAEPAMGLDQIVGLADQRQSWSVLGGFDRVQFEAREGLAVTRLTKYFGHAPRIA